MESAAGAAQPAVEYRIEAQEYQPAIYLGAAAPRGVPKGALPRDQRRRRPQVSMAATSSGPSTALVSTGSQCAAVETAVPLKPSMTKTMPSYSATSANTIKVCW